MLIETSKALRAHLGETSTAHTASTNMGINKARETARTTKFAVSSLADGAAAEDLIECTGEATRAIFFEALVAITTARVLEMVINCAREAA